MEIRRRSPPRLYPLPGFKIDVIVWKYGFKDSGVFEGSFGFKIDVIVWKFGFFRERVAKMSSL